MKIKKNKLPLLRISLFVTAFLNLVLFLTIHNKNVKGLRSSLTHSFLSCLKDVGNKLPINASGKLVAHHWDASGPLLWNENIRFNPFPDSLPQNPLILDVGGHVNAADSERLLQMFPAAKIHIYEPVPIYFEQLKQRWIGRSCCVIHNVGLGGFSRNVTLHVENLAGQSTFVMEEVHVGGRVMVMQIVDGRDVITEFLSSGSTQVDILHVNCEGCEWEFLERLVSSDVLGNIAVLQVSFHNYGANGIGSLLHQYCLIREALEESHNPVNVVPFGWERWIRKDINFISKR